jgi:hypothetical protein
MPEVVLPVEALPVLFRSHQRPGPAPGSAQSLFESCDVLSVACLQSLFSSLLLRIPRSHGPIEIAWRRCRAGSITHPPCLVRGSKVQTHGEFIYSRVRRVGLAGAIQASLRRTVELSKLLQRTGQKALVGFAPLFGPRTLMRTWAPKKQGRGLEPACRAMLKRCSATLRGAVYRPQASLDEKLRPEAGRGTSRSTRKSRC